MKKIKFFTIGLGLSMLVFSTVDSAQFALEDFFVQQVYVPEKVLLAQISRESLGKKSLDIDIRAKAVLVLKLKGNGRQAILYNKNSEATMPIASLTKLMTAIVSLETLPPDKKIEITESMVSQEGNSGKLKKGEKIAVSELLKMALVESSNDAADALAEAGNKSDFVDLMNLKAKELGLESTNFSNSTGLEAENNFSTARDMANLTAIILQKYPSILEISSQPSLLILTENGELHHHAFNTNELLVYSNKLGRLEMVGGKTGYTEESGGCIVVVVKDQNSNYFINVILGADSRESRFSEMKKIIEAINEL